MLVPSVTPGPFVVPASSLTFAALLPSRTVKPSSVPLTLKNLTLTVAALAPLQVDRIELGVIGSL